MSGDRGNGLSGPLERGSCAGGRRWRWRRPVAGTAVLAPVLLVYWLAAPGGPGFLPVWAGGLWPFGLASWVHLVGGLAALLAAGRSSVLLWLAAGESWGGEGTSRLLGLVYLLADRGVAPEEAVRLVLRIGDAPGRGELRGLCFELRLLLGGAPTAAPDEQLALEEVLGLLDGLTWGGRGSGRCWRRLGGWSAGLALAVLVLVVRPDVDAGWSRLAFWFGPGCLLFLGALFWSGPGSPGWSWVPGWGR